MKTLTMTLVAACCFALMGTRARADEPVLDVGFVLFGLYEAKATTMETVHAVEGSQGQIENYWTWHNAYTYESWAASYVAVSWDYFMEAVRDTGDLVSMDRDDPQRQQKIEDFEYNRGLGYAYLQGGLNYTYYAAIQPNSRTQPMCIRTYLEVLEQVEFTARYMAADVEAIVQYHRDRLGLP